eukprot:COSAG01_NODE_231_length_21019_cov_104.980501_17_plen_87_part_00
MAACIAYRSPRHLAPRLVAAHAKMARTTTACLFPAVLFLCITPAQAYRFMAIGDWGASFESGGIGRDTCGGKVCEQQAADAVQMGK